MAETAGLREPDQMNWDKHNPGSTWQAPPVPVNASGEAIIYRATLPKSLGSPDSLDVTDEGFRSFEAGPLKLTGNNNSADGYEIRFYTVNVKKFTNKKTGEPMEVSSASKLLRAAGIQDRPQKNVEYEAAMKKAAGRNIQLALDWRAKDKESGVVLAQTYAEFPDDPMNPGRKLAILKRGQKMPNGTVVTSEVAFANAQVRFVVDPSRK